MSRSLGAAGEAPVRPGRCVEAVSHECASVPAVAPLHVQGSVVERHRSASSAAPMSGSVARTDTRPSLAAAGEAVLRQTASDAPPPSDAAPAGQPEPPVEGVAPAAGKAETPVEGAAPAAGKAELPVEGAAPAAGKAELPVEGAAPAAGKAEQPVEGATPAAGKAEPLVDDNAEPALTDGIQFAVRPLVLPGLPSAHLRHVLSNGRYLVTKTASAALIVWRLEDGTVLTAQPMQNILLPHPRVECMALQDDCGHLLATCAQNILLWDLREAGRAPVTLGEDFSGVTCCHLSSGGDAEVGGGAAVLSVGVSQAVWLLDTARVRHLLTLRGHECAVTCVRLQGTLCAAGSESGQVKVWDVSGPSLLYSSHAVAPRPVCDVTSDRAAGVVVAGCGSQVTAAAAAAADGRWAEVASAELERPAPEGRSASPRPECAVLSLMVLRRPSPALFGPHSLLLAATTGGLTVLNTHTWLPVYTAPDIGQWCRLLCLLSQHPHLAPRLHGTGQRVSGAVCCVCCPNTHTWLPVYMAPDIGVEPWGGSSVSLTPGGAVVVCGRSALQGRVTAFCVDVLPDCVPDRLSQLSIVCRHPLPAGSVLRARPPRTAPCRATQPARKVRSSGYGTAPRRTMFQPRTNTSRPRPAKSVAPRLSLSSLPTAEQRPAVSPDRRPGRPTLSYQCHVTPPPAASRPLRILRQGDTLLRIALSGNGRHLACASRQGRALEVARLHQLEVSQDQFLLGTQGAIAAVAWSLSGSRLAAVSAAGVHLWTFPGGELCGRRPAGSSPFTTVQFFFTDEFLLLSRGDTVSLCRLPAEDATSTAAAHSSGGRSSSLPRPALQCRLPCREVLHVAGACQFRSTLAVACCSDHSLRLLDVQAGRVVSTLSSAHPRPPHLARLCEGSPHLPSALPLYDLVGSVAMSDGVRLWDVRSGRLAVRLPARDLRALPAGFQVSSCGRLLALGSDAAHVWLWDLRGTCGPLARLRTAAAGVSDVAFHPRRAGLVAALLDGRVQTWSLDGGPHTG